MTTAPKTAFVTGHAGFIGYHLSELLLSKGWKVVGLDALTDYYDVALKKRRVERLSQHEGFTSVIGRLEDEELVNATVAEHAPHAIVHLAAQAGVRYSIDNPRSYVDANLIGTFHILEAARHNDVKHLLMASTSSVFGANTDMPFDENQKCDTQMSFYAATKKANESMAHSYAHLFNIPTTMFRFFTVYGPWGRPDMALFKFTKAMLEDTPIDVFNHGKMKRDFTYVGDLVESIRRLIDAVPGDSPVNAADSLSPVAPWRVVNIGNSDCVELMDYIGAVEKALGVTAKKNFMDMQAGDVPATWANTSLLKDLTGYQPGTPVDTGVAAFVDWYREYYGV